MENFKQYADYYNMLYKDKDYAGETWVINNLIKHWMTEAENILNMGCGTGRHDSELCKLGYRVYGIDLSENMISIAKKNNYNSYGNAIQYEVADIRKFKTKMKFDAVLSLFHVISYQNSNQDLIETFSTIADALKDNGIAVFDTWYGVGVLRDLPVVRIKRMEDEKLRITRIAEPEFFPNHNIVHVNYNIHIFDKIKQTTNIIKETHSMRYLFLPEVQFYLNKCGLELLECLDCKDLKKPDFDSWTVYYIVRKLRTKGNE